MKVPDEGAPCPGHGILLSTAAFITTEKDLEKFY